jgi:hypothetical protein
MAGEYGDLIKPTFLRLKFRFSDRNPISVTELRRREEHRAETELRRVLKESIEKKGE